MQILSTLQGWIVLGLSIIALGVEVYAFVDCVRRRPDAFVAAGKRTKQFWVIVTAIAMLLGVVSVGGVALLQVLPATTLPGSSLAVIGLASLYAITLGVVTLAVEALAGLVGLAAAAASYFVLATPLLSGTSHYLLPPPWPTMAPLMPVGAAQDALAAFLATPYEGGRHDRRVAKLSPERFLA